MMRCCTFFSSFGSFANVLYQFIRFEAHFTEHSLSQRESALAVKTSVRSYRSGIYIHRERISLPSSSLIAILHAQPVATLADCPQGVDRQATLAHTSTMDTATPARGGGAAVLIDSVQTVTR